MGCHMLARQACTAARWDCGTHRALVLVAKVTTAQQAPRTQQLWCVYERVDRCMQHWLTMCFAVQACGDAALYCAAGSGSPVPVSAGYYSGPLSVASTLRSTQLQCGPGSYCVNGTQVRQLCVYASAARSHVVDLCEMWGAVVVSSWQVVLSFWLVRRV